MNETDCLLCRSKNISLIETISTRQLSKLYQARAGVDVKRFFEKESLDLFKCNNCSLKFYWPQVAGDGKFYDDLQHYRNYYLDTKAEYIEAAKYINSSDQVLEIGCGEGLFNNFINCRSYTGLEFSDAAIKKAADRKLHVLKQKIEEHSLLHKEKYDIVCSFQVLEHIEDPEKFIKLSVICLKPGGKLIIAVPNEDSFINKAVNFYLNMPPHHTTRWTNETLRNVAVFNKLSIETFFYEPLQPFHKLFYLKTCIYNKIESLFGLSHKSVDTGLQRTIVYGFATLLSYVISPFFTKFQNTRGQSVLVVYKK